MAESQVLFPYDDASLAAIRSAISDPRFATYVASAGHDAEFAVGLYLYNARLSKSLLFPLHIVEVTLRNGIDDLLCSLYGQDWPSEAGFRAILTAASLEALNRAIDRVLADKGQNAPRGQIVATLTFDFWSNLFRAEYDRSLWQVHLRKVLPNLPPSLNRVNVQASVKEINQLRNRIAHHEPILGWDVTALHKKVIDLVSARCDTTGRWLKHYSTLSSVIRTKPTRQIGRRPTIGEICDPLFTTVQGPDTLLAVLGGYTPKIPALIRVDGDGAPTAVLPTTNVLHYIAQSATTQGGLVDLSEHDIDAVVAAEGLGASWAGMDASEPILMGINTLQIAGVKALVVTEGNEVPASIKGVIVRAHRRY